MSRPDGGYIFHGGCHDCVQPLHRCPDCRYMEPNWDLPNLNPPPPKTAEQVKVDRLSEIEHNKRMKERELEHERMQKLAYKQREERKSV